MEVQATVFPGKEGKSQPVKSKYNRGSIAGPKPGAKEQPLVQRRVFGTARNSNIQEKTALEKPKWQRPSLKPMLTTPPKEPAKKITSNRKPFPNKLVQTSHAPEEPSKTTQPVHSTPPVQTIPPAPEEPPKTAQLLKTAPPAPDEPSKTTQLGRPTPLAPVESTKTSKTIKTTPPTRDNPPKTAQPVVFALLAPEEPTKTTQLVETAPLAPELAPEEPSKTTQLLETDPPAKEQPPKTAKPVETDPPELLKTDKPVQTTPPVPEEQPKPARTNKPRKKKSVSFTKGKGRISDAGPALEGDRVGMWTPRPTRAKPRVSGTPYHTAERCSKCRFDRMERASYWLAQVKLAEAVGKHFVSAGLFKLALESKAEPNWSIRGEVKRYLFRNMYLLGEPEWGDVTASYGLSVTPHDQVEVKAQDENGG